MMHPTIDIKTFLKPGVRAHLAGIGGVSMCPLAEVLLGMGLRVQGSDMTESDTVRQLRQQRPRAFQFHSSAPFSAAQHGGSQISSSSQSSASE